MEFYEEYFSREQKDPVEAERYLKEFEALKLARAERQKAQEDRYKQLNQETMRSLFDQMTKLDSDPDSKQSQQYLK